MSRTTKNETTKQPTTNNDEAQRERVAKLVMQQAEKMLADATSENVEQIAASAKLCERLAHAIYFDMPRALKRCEKATRKLTLAKEVREYIRARFETLSRI